MQLNDNIQFGRSALYVAHQDFARLGLVNLGGTNPARGNESGCAVSPLPFCPSAPLPGLPSHSEEANGVPERLFSCEAT